MPAADRYIAIVRDFADLARRHTADRWGPEPTPLYTDGAEIATGAPIDWRSDGRERVLSNFGNQQRFMRVLTGLSGLGQGADYAAAAQDCAAYTLAHCQHENGLLYWGGHVGWDLRHREGFGHGPHHELKTHYPYYELMYRADPAAASRFIQAIWRTHIRDWDSLDLSRHGKYDDAPAPGETSVWDRDYGAVPVFFVGEGLSFANAGSDIFFAAAQDYAHTGDTGALTWAKRLAGRYAETRDPDTGLGGYQFSQVENDRCQLQFGEEWGPYALEGRILDAARPTTRFGRFDLIQMHIYELIGDDARDFLQWAHEDLTAVARHLYDWDARVFQPMWSDGRKLTPADHKRPGYYSQEILKPKIPDAVFARTYATAYRITGDDAMWRMAVEVCDLHGIRGLPTSPGAAQSLSVDPDLADPELLLALLELHYAKPAQALLDAACQIADQVLTARLHHGWFTPSADHLYARIDERDPLAILHLAAALRDEPDAVPTDRGSSTFFQAEFTGLSEAIKWNRIRDSQVYYDRTANAD